MKDEETVMSWNEVQTQDDVGTLMKTFCEFHDACVREVHIWTGHFIEEDFVMRLGPCVCARMLIQRQAPNPSAIELVFSGVRDFHLSPPPSDYFTIIFGASLSLDDGLIRWSDEIYYPDNEDAATWIDAERLMWRDASDWMGDVLRYGPHVQDASPIQLSNEPHLG